MGFCEAGLSHKQTRKSDEGDGEDSALGNYFDPPMTPWVGLEGEATPRFGIRLAK